MAEEQGKHVFISYVSEDSERVDALCKVLEAASIPYWRDRKDLGPGDAWKAKIREAIQNGALVFLACFSDQSRAKAKSVMNEEINIAVEEFRKMPPSAVWLMPVRFDAGDLPEWELTATKMLSDLNYTDLFGDDYAANAARLVTAIHRVLGETQVDAATALAAVQQATDANRTDLLERATKEMVPDLSKRIALDDLIAQEVRGVAAVLTDPQWVAGPIEGTLDQQLQAVAEAAQEIWHAVRPFCASLQVAARWGTPDTVKPWANGLRTLVGAALKQEGGVGSLLALRHVPGVFGIFTAVMACQANGTWENLRVLVVDPVTRDPREQKARPIIDVTDPFRAFSGTHDSVMNALAHNAITDCGLAEAVPMFTGRQRGKYKTPIAEWMHRELRPLFADQFADDEAYDAAFDAAEALLGVLAQDVVHQRKAAGEYAGHVSWFGRSAYRAHEWNGHGDAVADLAAAIKAQGASWPPLAVGLFGGDSQRAIDAADAFKARFDVIVNQTSFS